MPAPTDQEIDAAPLRILVVTNLYPSARAPAFGTFVAAHVRALREAGHTVDVAAIVEHRLHRAVARKYLRLARDATLLAVRAVLARSRYDVVEAHIAFPTGLIAWLPARLGRSSLVLHAHGSDVLRLPHRSRAHLALARWCLRRADLVVANSRTVAEAAERVVTLRRPAVVVSPGVDVPDAPSADGGDRAGVLFVGRLAQGKGLDVLLAAMDQPPLRDLAVHLRVVGDGPDRARCEAVVAASDGLRDRVVFEGALPPSAVSERYRGAMVVAVPSTEPEGLGLSALEAMAHGALVVATAVGGLGETMVDGVNGWVVAPHDPVGLAAAIGEALATARGPGGEARRAAGRRTAAAHDRTVMTTRLVDAYRSL